MTTNTDEILQKAANEARGLAIDAVEARASGHLGLPLGCAEVGAVLFSEILKFDPKNPNWLGRDRFILSAGHGSMFLYAWLNITGYDLPMDEIKNFRLKGSKTPGHPEYGETPGVEVTSGPLGQGIGNSVGMAISEKMAAARFNTPDMKVFDHKIWTICGDGCMQEGVSAEASSLAGKLQLDNLIIIYDSNDVTLDADEKKSCTENTAMRYEAYGWEVFTCNGHNIEDVRKTLIAARDSQSRKPRLIVSKTIIAKGIPEVENSAKGHGEGGAKFAAEARKNLGLPEQKFYVSKEIHAFFEEKKAERIAESAKWNASFVEWQKINPDKAAELNACINRKDCACPKELLKSIPAFPENDNSATRASSGKIMNILAKKLPYMVTGAADLFGSTKNYLKDMGDFDAETPSGRNIWFGIREHAMGTVSNGIAYYGVFEPSCATFLTFAGYMLGSIRVAALARLQMQYVFTHDSIGVGMDGPTHQPVEMASILRCIPHLDVIRPADSEECAAAWAMALARKDGPTALILSRQDLPILNSIPLQTRREGTLKGAYIAKKETAELQKIIIATGSELQFAIKAGEAEPGTRVVSMPSMEVFERQSADYKEEVLPHCCQNRIAIEAGVTGLWYKYANKVVGTDDFGFSADAPELFEAFGIDEQAVLG